MTCGRTQHARAEAVFPPAQAALSEPKGSLLSLYLPHFLVTPAGPWHLQLMQKWSQGTVQLGEKGVGKEGRE